MSTNYGRSRKSQMLLGLLLQFSEFLLFQVPRKKKRRHKIKKKKMGEMAFQQVDWQLLLVPAIMWYEKLI
jgi:hypothetical protein